jgi:hypothetical protein
MQTMHTLFIHTYNMLHRAHPLQQCCNSEAGMPAIAAYTAIDLSTCTDCQSDAASFTTGHAD